MRGRHLGRDRVVERHGAGGAAGERARVLDREPDLAHGDHVAVEPGQAAAAAQRDARGVAGLGERLGEVLVLGVEPANAGQRRARRRGRRGARGRRRKRSEHRGQPVEHRAEALAHAAAPGSIGSSSAPDEERRGAPTVASSERVKSNPSGGWRVATSTAEAPACEASSVPPPTSVAASMASPVDDAHLPGARADRPDEQVAR